eukprot:340692-Amorphochlora_amoeboformis.AAC.1
MRADSPFRKTAREVNIIEMRNRADLMKEMEKRGLLRPPVTPMSRLCHAYVTPMSRPHTTVPPLSTTFTLVQTFESGAGEQV